MFHITDRERFRAKLVAVGCNAFLSGRYKNTHQKSRAHTHSGDLMETTTMTDYYDDGDSHKRKQVFALQLLLVVLVHPHSFFATTSPRAKTQFWDALGQCYQSQ